MPAVAGSVLTRLARCPPADREVLLPPALLAPGVEAARHARHRAHPQRHVPLARPPRRPAPADLQPHRRELAHQRLPQGRRDTDQVPRPRHRQDLHRPVLGLPPRRVTARSTTGTPAAPTPASSNILLGGAGDAPFSGHLQSDGLRAYTTFIARQPENTITPVSCLAHIRRKFVEAKGDHPKITAWILYQIGKIYRIESELRESTRRPRGAKTGRGKERPAASTITSKNSSPTSQDRRRITPASRLGKALSYARDQLPAPRALLRGRSDRVRQQPHRERHPADEVRA